jgi:photosystem II stability/assembly factor-like uncharacterized protein
MKRLISSVVMVWIVSLIYAQYPKNPIKPSLAKDRISAAKQRLEASEQSIYTSIPATNIGPTIMSGRVVDVSVNPNNTKHFFVAYATGGVWETKNNGQSFTPIFNNNGYTNNCGALSVDWKSETIYVGTGEANSSRSSYAGYGVFKASISTEKYHWEHLGLEATQHIARILIHPSNPSILYVATLGNLFSPNKERGVYKSTDGGKTWKQALFISEDVGIIDVEFNPNNTEQLMAAAWDKGRRAWNFWESGTNSGIYYSKNAGENWGKSTSFIQGDFVGRIGLSTSADGTIYALLDNQDEFEKEEKASDKLDKKAFLTMSKDSFLNLNDSALNKFLKDNRFPEKNDAKNIKKLVKRGEIEPRLLFDYLTDSNAALFDKNVKGAEVYVSKDFGETWEKTHTDILEKVVYSYGYYFGTIAVSPSHSEQVYIAGVPLLKSSNGGKTFSFVGGDNVHVDHHYIWINPNDTNHLINGNDGGINISYDGGENWIKCNSPAVGQFYTVAVDKQKNYNVYGGLQDNGVWKGPNSYKPSSKWHEEGRYPYQRLLGGDGMRIEIDDDGSVYTGYQFGHYYRIDPNGKRTYIHPMQQLKESPLRWNWQTPILLSSHNQQILYMGSHKLHRSMDRGETFKEISDDLTNGPVKGDVSYGTLTDISESPLKFGLIYTGSDDGKVFCTRDGGHSWLDCSAGLPKAMWIKRVVASQHQESRVYVVLNGHTWDYFEAMLFCSDDYGKTWKQIGKNLPDESLNVLREDPNNANQLYLGSDAGVFVSFNKGETFESLGELPIVPVHDMAIQKEKNDLILGTHGRSIYKLSLQALNTLNTYKDSSLYLFTPEKVKYSANWGERSYNWEVMQPRINFSFVTPYTEELTIEIVQGSTLLFRETIMPKRGYNSVSMPVSFQYGQDKYPQKGEYTLSIVQNFESARASWIIE